MWVFFPILFLLLAFSFFFSILPIFSSIFSVFYFSIFYLFVSHGVALHVSCRRLAPMRGASSLSQRCRLPSSRSLTVSLSFSLALCGLYQFSACRHSSHWCINNGDGSLREMCKEEVREYGRFVGLALTVSQPGALLFVQSLSLTLLFSLSLFLCYCCISPMWVCVCGCVCS